MRIPSLAAFVALAVTTSAALAAPSTGAPEPTAYLADQAQAHPAIAKSFASLTAALPKSAEWVKSYGTASPGVPVQLDGHRYLVYTGCKPHDCPAETYAVLYDTQSRQMVAGAYVVNTSENNATVASTIQWLGKPNFDQTRLLGGYLY